ncbi:hypothetical protein DLAC_05111 [Tieghemostelium lacteum]|uniref:Uncharacterized protein n=1 Tax=Tieghemostelium lacteum TaxID=361077 RepID=A0A151ZIA9_TIELA|nr:hypothetical protein DLAC_05111 [Tieghemostelium lacteum]|eukprot:KYQ93722.1 hypothetical protein DLAC_05111 [Tieghemostelium lacteum]
MNKDNNTQPTSFNDIDIPKEHWNNESVQKWCKVIGIPESDIKHIRDNNIKGRWLVLKKDNLEKELKKIQVSANSAFEIYLMFNPTTRTDCLINPQDFYGEISPRAITDEGIHNLLSPLTLFRQELCMKVSKHLETNKVTLIRSPPFTGKTSFGQIFHEYLKNTKQKVYIRRVCLIWLQYDRVENFQNSWKFYTGRTFTEWFNFAESNDVHFILDNVQTFYNPSLAIYDLFWSKIKSAPHRITFLMLAGYGERPGSQLATPISLHYEDPQILFLKLSEYNGLCKAYAMKHFPLPEYAISIIWAGSGGHIGIIYETLHRIKHKYKDSGVNEKNLVAYLQSQDFFNTIKDTRSCPKIHDSNGDLLLSKEELGILDHVIDYKYFHSVNSDDLALSKLIKRGYLIKIGDKDIYKFPSPWYYKIYLFQRKTKIYEPFWGRLPENKEGITKLLIEALKRFRLFRAEHTLSVGNNNRILEVFWHNELYVSLSNYFNLPHISSNVGKFFGSTGEVDLYINSDLQWAIEIIGDGIQIEEHMLRFLPTGIYGADLPIKQWVVLDFRLSAGNIPLQEQLPENYILIVASDYKYFTLYSKELYQFRVIANGEDLFH